ncbi:URC4/urg3 family protein [Legionella fairfieldensis]|uniref:URC4/urg3 family protein n=1 Tax=Legionella fairfieldensis TaxID=45064 RepID=UPI00048BDA3B|nr:URC4/urg3 family protein [Legionella fairfieldensis]
MTNSNEISVDVLKSLQNLQTIRQQAQRILALARQNGLRHFILDESKMAFTVDWVLEVIDDQYPSFTIPYHSRWRHFEVGGVDRIKKMNSQLAELSAEEQGKILYELVILSVLLDAGAGKRWIYKEQPGDQRYSRSEGLALASLALYLQGAFSADVNQPLRVDAERLIQFSRTDFKTGFQVSDNNPLDGIKGRIALLNQLGKSIQTNEACFGREGRLGNFYSCISSLQVNQAISVPHIFQAVLTAFGEIWPERIRYHGISLGDVWPYSALKTEAPASELIPFHKLSQWLTYSLIEPLEKFGIQVTDLDELTGLPEYRNGGLLIDTGLLQVKNETVLQQLQAPDSEVIVEWRALTVALLDELAVAIRQRLQKSAAELPLAKILQGGTWEAGRRLARQKRADGIPPIQIISDGTIF